MAFVRFGLGVMYSHQFAVFVIGVALLMSLLMDSTVTADELGKAVDSYFTDSNLIVPLYVSSSFPAQQSNLSVLIDTNGTSNFTFPSGGGELLFTLPGVAHNDDPDEAFMIERVAIKFPFTPRSAMDIRVYVSFYLDYSKDYATEYFQISDTPTTPNYGSNTVYVSVDNNNWVVIPFKEPVKSNRAKLNLFSYIGSTSITINQVVFLGSPDDNPYSCRALTSDDPASIVGAIQVPASSIFLSPSRSVVIEGNNDRISTRVPIAAMPLTQDFTDLITQASLFPQSNYALPLRIYPYAPTSPSRGPALVFTNQLVELSLECTRSFSYTAWFYISQLPPGGTVWTLFSTVYRNSQAGAFSAGITGDGQLFFGVQTPSDNYYYYTQAGSQQIGGFEFARWYHVTYTYDDDTQYKTIYVNGVIAAHSYNGRDDDSTSYNRWSPSGQYVTLGYQSDVSYPLKGGMQCFAAWDYPITAAHAQAIYNRQSSPGSSRPCQTIDSWFPPSTQTISLLLPPQQSTTNNYFRFAIYDNTDNTNATLVAQSELITTVMSSSAKVLTAPFHAGLQLGRQYAVAVYGLYSYRAYTTSTSYSGFVVPVSDSIVTGSGFSPTMNTVNLMDQAPSSASINDCSDSSVLAHFSFDADFYDHVNGYLLNAFNYSSDSSSFRFGGASLSANQSMNDCIDLVSTNSLVAVPLIELMKKWSISLWYYHTSSSNTLTAIFASGNSSQAIGLDVNTASGKPLVEFYYRTDSSQQGRSYAGPSSPLLANTWNHIVVTSYNERMSQQNVVRVYINNTVVINARYAAPQTSTSTSRRFSVGSSCASGTGSAYMRSGAIDELWIFGSTLSSLDINNLNIYNWPGAGAPPLSALIGVNLINSYTVSEYLPPTCDINFGAIRIFLDNWLAPSFMKRGIQSLDLTSTIAEAKWWSDLADNPQFRLASIPACYPFPYVNDPDAAKLFTAITNAVSYTEWFAPGLLELFNTELPSYASTPTEQLQQARLYYRLLGLRDIRQTAESMLRSDVSNFFIFLGQDRTNSLIAIQQLFASVEVAALQAEIIDIANSLKKSTTELVLEILSFALSVAAPFFGGGAVGEVVGSVVKTTVGLSESLTAVAKNAARAEKVVEVAQTLVSLGKDGMTAKSNVESLESSSSDSSSDSSAIQRISGNAGYSNNANYNSFNGFGGARNSAQQYSWLFNATETAGTSDSSSQAMHLTATDIANELIRLNEYYLTGIDSIISNILNNYAYLRIFNELSFSVQSLTDLNSALSQALNVQDLIWQRTLLLRFFNTVYDITFIKPSTCKLTSINFHAATWNWDKAFNTGPDSSAIIAVKNYFKLLFGDGPNNGFISLLFIRPNSSDSSGNAYWVGQPLALCNQTTIDNFRNNIVPIPVLGQQSKSIMSVINGKN